MQCSSSESVAPSLRELYSLSGGVSDSLKSRKKESSIKLLLSYDFFNSGVSHGSEESTI